MIKTSTSLDRLPEESMIKNLRSALRGQLILPGENEYDSARQVWNGRIDRKPAMITRCAGVLDVIRALDFARQNNIPLSIRSSGHNVTGCSVCDGGIVIDLSRMKGIEIDSQSKKVRAQAGVTWGELDHETQAFGLATTGGRVSTTGIAGVTLGGGYGWLMRKYGLAIDNLLSVDVVTANGTFLTANATQNENLFWGIRGGGGNFGIVTAFEFCLHPVGPLVTAGVLFYPPNRAMELLHFYREWMACAADELSTQFNFLIAPPAPFVPPNLRGRPVVAIAVCHVGSTEAANRDLAGLQKFGQPLLERIKPVPYTALQRSFDFAGVFGNQVYSKSGHLPELSDGAIECLAMGGPAITSSMSIVMLSSLGGAVAQIEENATAFSFRNTLYDYAIDSVWKEPEQSEQHILWTRKLWGAMQPFSTGAYVNELDDEEKNRAQEAYNPQTYQRLVGLKNQFDPENVFCNNQNIQPIL
jgi:FAD/FMN-containing dehydrogenase